MKKIALFAAGAMLLTILGCENTAEGIKKDAEKDSRQAAEAGRDIGSAISLTPTIKAAIVADPTLNDPGNEINVETSEEQVVLKGHVKTEEMKAMAADIAQRTIKDKGGKQSVVNELVVML
jgi:predicted small secreted protein